ncbi:uncharacterized protein KY384_005401 [Bacidia gigantensis]|uniref:uncharacterized protein n=1 Tax=Bacidia gigantensis TaxID=2732470 RepID=UPI001D042015|nr:uncharacterized protein KY384_005401 [Bacidia gigantensis]KAG8529920.1 hypothetical protein KY384_005401 [Bacidia gigantensis]
MRWLTNGYRSLQLDIIGFLAILGEASVTANAQVSLLSYIALLPRLLPAPQALIRTSRPLTLAPATGKVIGARSGGIRDFVNHIANLLHSREALRDYHVRCELIEKPDPSKSVEAATWGPLAYTSLLGTAMSVALLVLSIKKGDGFALLATLLLSFLTSLIGFGSRWSLDLKKRESTRNVPPDKIVIKYPNGSFRIIVCKEEVARELYWHPEACNYFFSEGSYRIVSLIGTLTLMMGVVCLGNSTLDLQVAFGASYLILNAVYWAVAALPQQLHWDLTCYKVSKVFYEGGEESQTFTMALWKAIALAGSTQWVVNGQVAPVSEGWKNWVKRAGDMVEIQGQGLVPNGTANGMTDGMGEVQSEKMDGMTKDTPLQLPEWDPEKALTECLNPID